MSFQISRDKDGKPAHVTHDTGFMITSEPYDPEQHGWMDTQLDPADFPAIQTGCDMEFLVREVNHLRRALWSKGREVNTYRKAAGFGEV